MDDPAAPSRRIRPLVPAAIAAALVAGVIVGVVATRGNENGDPAASVSAVEAITTTSTSSATSTTSASTATTSIPAPTSTAVAADPAPMPASRPDPRRCLTGQVTPTGFEMTAGEFDQVTITGTVRNGTNAAVTFDAVRAGITTTEYPGKVVGGTDLFPPFRRLEPGESVAVSGYAYVTGTPDKVVWDQTNEYASIWLPEPMDGWKRC